jgi:hypothetical protein
VEKQATKTSTLCRYRISSHILIPTRWCIPTGCRPAVKTGASFSALCNRYGQLKSVRRLHVKNALQLNVDWLDGHRCFGRQVHGPFMQWLVYGNAICQISICSPTRAYRASFQLNHRARLCTTSIGTEFHFNVFLPLHTTQGATFSINTKHYKQVDIDLVCIPLPVQLIYSNHTNPPQISQPNHEVQSSLTWLLPWSEKSHSASHTANGTAIPTTQPGSTVTRHPATPTLPRRREPMRIQRRLVHSQEYAFVQVDQLRKELFLCAE